MIRTQLIVTAAAALMATGASAQDWNGPYAGAQIGSLNADTTATGRDNALSYGVHGGYLTELGGGLVLGGELEYDWTDLDLGAASVDAVGRAKLLAGFNAGVVMPYTVAGLARIDTSIGDGTGWLAGAGLAYQVTPELTVSGEILYHEFDDIGATTIDADATSANVRASFRF